MIENFDQCLRFRIEDKRISLIDEMAVEVVADNRNNICCRFECDEQWNEVAKVARFIYNGQWKDMVLDADCMCFVPAEVIKEGRFSVGLYGDNLKASTPLTVTVLASILSENEGELPDAPSEDVYTQILKITSDANAKADAATEAAWAAVNASTEAIKAVNKAKEEMEEAGFVNTIKEKHEGVKLGFWVGTQAEYDALETAPTDCYVLIEDDETLPDLEDKIDALATGLSSQKKLLEGLSSQLGNMIKVGTYTGNADANSKVAAYQTIDIGVTPSIIFVFTPGRINESSNSANHVYSAMAMPGIPFENKYAVGLEALDSGFKVCTYVNDTGVGGTKFHLNDEGDTYIYLAISLGGE